MVAWTRRGGVGLAERQLLRRAGKKAMSSVIRRMRRLREVNEDWSQTVEQGDGTQSRAVGSENISKTSTDRRHGDQLSGCLRLLWF